MFFLGNFFNLAPVKCDALCRRNRMQDISQELLKPKPGSGCDLPRGLGQIA